jgi:hypothetical protein
MHHMSAKIRGSLAGMAACLILAIVVAVPSGSQESKVTQTAGVDNTKMGAYRALAQLSFLAFQKRDMATASELARIIERTWDAAEAGSGPKSLEKKDKALFDRIDRAMDAFVKPVIQYSTTAPNPAAVEAAYNEFLKQLKQGD